MQKHGEITGLNILHRAKIDTAIFIKDKTTLKVNPFTEGECINDGK
jgi:hypothetical protein